jgi:hypothetical protein
MLSTPWCANGVTALGELGSPSVGLGGLGSRSSAPHCPHPLPVDQPAQTMTVGTLVMDRGERLLIVRGLAVVECYRLAFARFFGNRRVWP